MEKEKKREVEYLTFVHRFNGNLTATLRVIDQPPADGCFRPEIEWSTRPKYDLTKQYRKWILRTNQVLADRWQISIAYGLMVGPGRTELWKFIPLEKPSLAGIMQVTDEGIFYLERDEE